MAAFASSITRSVILNLFQDPSGLGHEAVFNAPGAAAARLRTALRLAAAWILKQVQDDENGNGGHFRRVEFIR